MAPRRLLSPLRGTHYRSSRKSCWWWRRRRSPGIQTKLTLPPLLRTDGAERKPTAGCSRGTGWRVFRQERLVPRRGTERQRLGVKSNQGMAGCTRRAHHCVGHQERPGVRAGRTSPLLFVCHGRLSGELADMQRKSKRVYTTFRKDTVRFKLVLQEQCIFHKEEAPDNDNKFHHLSRTARRG